MERPAADLPLRPARIFDRLAPGLLPISDSSSKSAEFCSETSGSEGTTELPSSRLEAKLSSLLLSLLTLSMYPDDSSPSDSDSDSDSSSESSEDFLTFFFGLALAFVFALVFLAAGGAFFTYFPLAALAVAGLCFLVSSTISTSGGPSSDVSFFPWRA